MKTLIFILAITSFAFSGAVLRNDSINTGGAKATRLYSSTATMDSIYSANGVRFNRVYIDSIKSPVRVTRLNADTIRSILDSTGYIKADSGCFGNTINKSCFSTAGHFQMFAGAMEWDDMDQFVLSQAKNIGATGAPDLVAGRDGFSYYQFNASDSLEGTIEHGHRFVEGDSLHWHYHFMPSVKDATQRYVKFSLHYIVRNIGDSLTYEGTITRQDTIAANTSTKTGRLSEISETAMPLVKLGAQITIMFKHIAPTPDSQPTAGVFVTQVGIHKKIDCFGSRQELVK